MMALWSFTTSLRVGKRQIAFSYCLAMVPGSGKRKLIIFHCRLGIGATPIELFTSSNRCYYNYCFRRFSFLRCINHNMSHENEGSVHHPADAPSPPSLDALPRHIVTAFILPCITSSDWLNFRLASRTCYCLVHGSGANDVPQFCCPTCRPLVGGDDASNLSNDGIAITPSSNNDVLSDNLGKLALVREFQFEDGTNEEERSWMCQSFHMPPYQPGNTRSAVLSTSNMFKASSIFIHL